MKYFKCGNYFYQRAALIHFILKVSRESFYFVSLRSSDYRHLKLYGITIHIQVQKIKYFFKATNVFKDKGRKKFFLLEIKVRRRESRLTMKERLNILESKILNFMILIN